MYIHTRDCAKKTPPPEKKTLGKIGLQKTKSGAGTQFSPTGLHGRGLHKRSVFSHALVSDTFQWP